MATRRIDPSADRGRVAVCFHSIPPQPAARPRCVAKVNRRGSAGGFHRDRQSKAVTANSGRVASGHGVVASGHGVAKYAMLPPLHRCPVDVCSRHEHQNSVSDSPLSPAGVSTVGRDWMQPLRYPVHDCAVQYRAASDHKPRRRGRPCRSGPASLGARSRSALIHAPSSFTLGARFVTNAMFRSAKSLHHRLTHSSHDPADRTPARWIALGLLDHLGRRDAQHVT